MVDCSVLLDVQGLRVEFETPEQRICAVKGINFALPAGEITAMIGESGSGKSVTCLSLLGLAEGAAVSGTLRFAGMNGPSEIRPRLLAPLRGRRIGMIFQDPIGSLNPVRTIGAQLRETVRALTDARSKTATTRRALELLAAVRLPEPEALLSRYPHELSGGMNQRVMIALALAGAPDLLIADEPTTALDVTVQRDVLNLLAHLRDETGLTILLVTHDIDIARSYADRILVMRGGELVEQGTTVKLLTSPKHAYTQELLASRASLLDRTPEPALETVRYA